MTPLRITLYALALAALLAILLSGAAAAQGGVQVPHSGYDLSWWTVDGGGATFSTGPGYSLGGTLGQPDAGLMAGPGYTLAGGFWPAAGQLPYRVYLPLSVRGYP
jgi:hypothetical protein